MQSRNESMNDFSYWYEQVKDCGIKTPKTIVIKVPEEMYKHFYMDSRKKDYNVIDDWVKENVIPLVEKNDMGLLFVKNARFSNKFDARTCMAITETLTFAITSINYAALCVGADGLSEIVIRDRIHHNIATVPCIYGGLPLRTEFRVFYDFDSQRVLYTANYWDYKTVARGLHEATDKIVFDYMKEKIETDFNGNKQKVEELVAEHMKNVQGLKGRWSIDIMLDDKWEPWLIDMALAERSAYWNPDLANEGE